MIGILLSVLYALVIAGQCSNQDKALSDKQLIAKVEEAVKKRVSPSEIERFVGAKACRNTIRKGDREVIRIMDFGTDRSVPNLIAMEHVVFWDRPVPVDDYPCIAWVVIGVVWPRSGDPQLFYACIYVP